MNHATVALVGLLVSRLALPTGSLAVGPNDEPCTTNGLQASGGNWHQTLTQANAGQTVLLRGGTYTVAGRLKLGHGVTVKPYNCEKVTVIGSWDLPGGNALAGLTLQGGGSGGHNWELTGNNTTLRHNLLIPHSTTGSGVRWNHGVSQVRIIGNDVLWAFPHNMSFSFHSASDIVFHGNQFRRAAKTVPCGSGGCGDFIGLGSGWTGTPGQYLILQENDFASIPANAEEYVDLKAPAAGAKGGWKLLGNALAPTDTNTCALVWGQAAGSTGLMQEVAYNVFRGCADKSLRLYMGPGGSGNFPRPEGEGFRVHHNQFICTKAGSSTAGQMMVDVKNAAVADNEFYDCELSAQKAGSGARFPDNQMTDGAPSDPPTLPGGTGVPDGPTQPAQPTRTPEDWQRLAEEEAQRILGSVPPPEDITWVIPVPEHVPTQEECDCTVIFDIG